MARPQRRRRICKKPLYNCFMPENSSECEIITLTLDEYEVIRLIDYERHTHAECSAFMDISRTTVTEVYERARAKIADCIVNGKILNITGGNYKICQGEAYPCMRSECRKREKAFAEKILKEKGADTMRVAVTYENGEIFQHFGHTEHFKIYDIQDGSVKSEQVVDTNGSGHGALAGMLSGLNIDVLICGGIGGGAQAALSEAGISLYGGVSGDADKAVQEFIAGSLSFNPDVKCNHHHHEEGHSCGGHKCGEDKHGCAGN